MYNTAFLLLLPYLDAESTVCGTLTIVVSKIRRNRRAKGELTPTRDEYIRRARDY